MITADQITELCEKDTAQQKTDGVTFDQFNAELDQISAAYQKTELADLHTLRAGLGVMTDGTESLSANLGNVFAQGFRLGTQSQKHGWLPTPTRPGKLPTTPIELTKPELDFIAALAQAWLAGDYKIVTTGPTNVINKIAAAQGQADTHERLSE